MDTNTRLSNLESIRIEETMKMIPADVERIIEVGCGDGRVSRRLGKKDFLVGIDIDSAKIRKFPSIQIVGDIGALPIKNNGFEIVLSCEVLEHLDNDKLRFACGEIERVSNKYILITVPFDETLPAHWLKCSKCKQIYHSWGHVRRFQVNNLINLFQKSHLIQTRFLGPKQRKLPPIFYLSTRKIGNVWHSDPRNPTACPKCGSLPENISGNILGKLLIRFLWRLEEIWPVKRAVWIGCLYRKVGG